MLAKALRKLQDENIIGEWALSGNDLSGVEILTDPKPDLTQDDCDQAYFRYLKKLKKQDLSKNRDQNILKSFAYDKDGDGVAEVNLKADEINWANYKEAEEGIAKGWIAGPITWTTADNSTVDLSQTDLNSIMGNLAQRKLACYDYEKSLISDIDAASTSDELDAIDIETGWPE